MEANGAQSKPAALPDEGIITPEAKLEQSREGSWNPVAKARERAQRVRERARESNTGLVVFMAMGSYAINLAASNEPDPDVRREKKRELLQRWNNYAADLVPGLKL